MGWWRDRAGRLLGDGPADVLEDALLQAGRAGPKPPLAAVLGAVAQALREAPGQLALARPDPWHVVAVADGQAVTEGAADEALCRHLHDALDDIADEYRSSELARLPTVAEVVGTLAFVLGHEPQRCVAGNPKAVSVWVEPAE